MRSVFIIISAAMALGACEQSPRDRERPAERSEPRLPAEPPPSPQASVAPEAAPEAIKRATLSDQEFVNKAAIAGKFEVESSQAAIKRGLTGTMKTFAQKMVTDHRKVNEELERLADEKDRAIDDDLDAEHEEMLDEVKKAPKEELASVFHRIHLATHEDAIELFEDCSELCADADLKAFAGKTLKVLRGHHAELQRVTAATK
jgi:putative membrane protein